jgi:flagellar hook-associated protein 2
VDIAGSINGIAATGKGQILIDATTGLRVQVAATAAGSYGNLALTLGYGATLGNLITSLSDPTSGPIATADNDLNQRITNLNTQETAFNSQMTQVEANYRAQFSALDASLSQMKTTSSFLTQQLASISSSTA